MLKSQIKNLIENCKSSKENFAEIIFEVYKNKIIEIYLGDEYEEVTTDQIKISYPSVICGKLVGAYGKCLFVNSFYPDKVTKKIKSGNVICLHDVHIKMITEYNNEGTIQDSFVKSKDNIILKKLVEND
jgi:hypothetical protein